MPISSAHLSFVLLGAGVNTRRVSDAIPTLPSAHHTPSHDTHGAQVGCLGFRLFAPARTLLVVVLVLALVFVRVPLGPLCALTAAHVCCVARQVG